MLKKEVGQILAITISSTSGVMFIMEDQRTLLGHMSEVIILDLSEYAYLGDTNLPPSSSEH